MNGPTRLLKPAYPPFMGLPRIPAMATLWTFDQWVAWDYIWREDKQKYDKPPVNAKTGRLASHSDPATWSSYSEALDRAKAFALPGVGFVLTEDDDLTGIDLDKCRNDESGVLDPWAAEILALAETYAEVSPSGTGVRLFARGKVLNAVKFDPAHIEIYVRQRYLTVTGRHINGTPLTINPAPITIGALLTRTEQARERLRAAKGNAAGPSGGTGGESSRRPNGHPASGKISVALRDPFWRAVNERALSNLNCWVPALFGSAAIFYPGTRGYRIGSSALSRDLEEDLSITPEGIKDWGVWDMGDVRDGRRSPIDVVMEHGAKTSAGDAALWLCERLGVEPEALGWHSAANNSGTADQPKDDLESPKELPTIRIIPGELPTTVDQAESAIIASNQPLFVRAGELVRPVTDIVPATRGRTTTIARLRPMCTDSMLDMLGQTASYVRFDGRKRGWVKTDPTSKIASLLLAREGAWRLPGIAGVITTPTLRPDGSLLSTPGYDSDTRLYLTPDKTFELPPIADQPTRADAEDALKKLTDLIFEFPFVGSTDRAVALSAIITAVVRGALTIAPLHAIRAHTPGTGKSLLVDVASSIATGRPCPVIAAGRTEEETEKRLGALLRDGVPIVSIDNVNGELGGDALCQITERPLVRVRILGLSEAPEFECRATIFATGNNLVLLGDMVRRTVLCCLDAGVERPELRRFSHNPIKRVLENRGGYVAAVLTIVRAYRAAGNPDLPNPIGSYTEWSNNVRAPLIWLGEADPVSSMETARDEDPELLNIREVFGHWTDHLGESSLYTTNSIVQIACEQDPLGQFVRPEFRDVLLRIAGDRGAVSTRSFGKWLSRIAGRVVDGRRLRVKNDSSHGNKFALGRAGHAG